MRPLRRNDNSPRVELLPMIDVVFLLLTFFIYCMVQLINAQVLPVELMPIQHGERAASAPLHAVMIAADGRYYFDKEPIAVEALREKLATLAEEPTPPMLFVAMEKSGEVDRGPLFMQLVQMIQEAGITNVSLVGPAEGG